MNSVIKFFVLFIMILTPGISGYASNVPPSPQRKSEALDSLKKHLERQELQKSELKQEIYKAKKNIEEIRKNLISTGESVQETSMELQSLESHVLALNKEKKQLKVKLKEDKKEISRLVLALQRLTQIPPEALLARPTSPVSSVRSGILIQSSIPVIQKQATLLKSNLERLDTVSRQLVKDRNELVTKSSKLARKREKLAGFLAQRKAFYKSQTRAYEELEKDIENMAEQAKTLGELLSKLKKREAKDKPPLPPAIQASFKSFRNLPQKSNTPPRLPVSGIIKTSYGDKDQYGAKSEGLKISTRDGALVVTPLSGVVKFAGKFGRFGQVIILKHAGPYHSLIANLDRIEVAPGQQVLTGEPLGMMGISRGSEKPILYYELRHKGEPADPALKFGSMG